MLQTVGVHQYSVCHVPSSKANGLNIHLAISIFIICNMVKEKYQLKVNLELSLLIVLNKLSYSESKRRYNITNLHFQHT